MKIGIIIDILEMKIIFIYSTLQPKIRNFK